MKRYLSLFLTFLIVALASAESIEKTASGYLLKLDVGKLELRFYGPEVVRVIKTPEEITTNRISPVIIKAPQVPETKVSETDELYSISTSALRIEVSKTGTVQFKNLNGIPLLSEMEDATSISYSGVVNGDTLMFIHQSFKLDDDERLFGLGLQQYGRLNLRNVTELLRQENKKVCIPYFQSSKGYALYWDNYSSTLFSDNSFDTHFRSEASNGIDYVFMLGKLGDELTASMRELTGQSPMLPLWAFGYIQSRDQYKTREELTDVVKQYRKLGIPLDAIMLGGTYWGDDLLYWNSMKPDKTAYGDLKEVTDQIHGMNAKMMISLWPSFGQHTGQYGVLSSRRSILYFQSWPPKSDVRVYDAYNPEARETYWQYVRNNLFDKGVDAWYMDGSEPVASGLTGEQLNLRTPLGSFQKVMNLYPLMLNKGMYEHQRATTSDKRVVMFSRSAFAGQQHYGSIITSGETTSSWETLKNQIPAALNLSATGIPYWSSDIGGFISAEKFPKGLEDKSFHELYVRWMQFSVFTPMMRSNGDTPREIDQFGKPGDWSFDAQAKALRLRYRLLPYLYATAWQVSSGGKSFMRPLYFEYPEDPETAKITDQYLFGTSFLVAPVIKAQYVTNKDNTNVEQFNETKKRSVYLPKGSWIDFWTGTTIKGGQHIEKETPIDIIPLYVSSGSIIPWGPDVTYATQDNWKELEIRVYPGADGSFTLYEDERDSYNYEQGAYSCIPFQWNEASQTLTIGDREGKFEGMLKKRSFKIVLVTPANNPADKTASGVNRTVTYKGSRIKVKL